MSEYKKSRQRVEPQTGEKQERTETFMPLLQFITSSGKSKAFYRKLIVRAIEDALVLLMLCCGIWVICTVVGTFFHLMGVV